MKTFRFILSTITWVIFTITLQGRVTFDGYPMALALDPSGNFPFRLITNYLAPSSIHTWDVKFGGKIVTINTDDVPVSAAWMSGSKNHEYFAVSMWGAKSKSIYLCDGYSGEIKRSYSKKWDGRPSLIYGFKALAFNQTEEFLASSIIEKTIDIIDAKTFKCLRTLEGHSERVLDLSFCPLKEKEHILASCSYDKTVCIWNAQSGELLRKLTGYDARVLSLAWHPNKYILASGVDGEVTISDLENNDTYVLEHSNGHYIGQLAYSPQGQYLLVIVGYPTERFKYLRVWDMETLRYRDFLEEKHIAKILWLSDEMFVAAETEGKLIYVDLKDYEKKE